jgi:predicted ArsR family transcriptional regulator
MTEEPLARLAPLADPVRRSLYDFVAAQSDAVDRDAAAAGVGVGRPLAAFHLDRLVRAGLLEAIYRRRSGRTGPGAGRPAKFYRRPTHEEISVSLPPRRYDALADLLAEAVEPSADARGRALELARTRGQAIAAAVAPETSADRDGLVATLADNGYERTGDLARRDRPAAELSVRSAGRRPSRAHVLAEHGDAVGGG